VTGLDYEYFRKFLRERSGLVLSADKHYLLESRLLPVARRAGLASLAGLVHRLRGIDCEALAAEVVEAMTTNESFFFRDKIPFEHFRDTIIPRLIAARNHRRRIRIWCAAASTGQEPYSLAMSIKEMGDRLSGWQIEIIAPTFPARLCEERDPEFTANSRCNAGCRSCCCSSISSRSAKIGKSDRTFARWCNFGCST
jgi:chemotaxis protein methyltransferase CheR